MIYSPKKFPRNAAVTSVILYGVTAALFIVSEFGVPYRLVFQLAALVALSIGLIITTRYILTDYKYVLKDIEKPGDEVTFTIVRVTGKREVVMANFNLRSVYAFEKCSSNREFEKKHGRVNKIYNYCSNFLSRDMYKLAIDFNEMKVVFSLELCEKFASEINARLNDGKDIEAGRTSGSGNTEAPGAGNSENATDISDNDDNNGGNGHWGND